MAIGLDVIEIFQQGHQRPVVTTMPGKLKMGLQPEFHPVILADNKGGNLRRGRLPFKSGHQQQAF